MAIAVAIAERYRFRPAQKVIGNREEAEARSFEDRRAGGISVYVNWMKQRVAALHRVRNDTGSPYLHYAEGRSRGLAI